MVPSLEEMPLFLLHTVLFPHAQLQLHVFEPRYLEMIRECQQADRPFGVVLIKDGGEVGPGAEPYMVGTAVRLISVEALEDGRLEVRVRGERRFRIRRLDESKSYLTGWVEPLAELEVEVSPRAEALREKAREYVELYIEQYFARIDMKVANIKMPTDPTALSFVIANFLQMENLAKQRLLETTDTVERIAEMIPVLEQHILTLQAEETVSANVERLSTEHFLDFMTRN